MKKIWRWLGFHSHEWSKWETQGNILIKDRLIGYWQTRSCSECGAIEIRKVI